MYEVELYHHGIKGQKWGIRRFQNKDGSYKSGAEGRYDGDGIIKKVSGSIKGGLAARKKSKELSSANKKLSAENKKLSAKNQKLEAKNQKLADKSKKEFHLSDRQKKALKIGVAVAGTALAAYGAKKLYDHVDATHKGKLLAKKLLSDAGGDFDKASAAYAQRLSKFQWDKNTGSLGKYGLKGEKIMEATRKGLADSYRKATFENSQINQDLRAIKEASRAHRKEQFAKATKGIRNAAGAAGNKAKAGASAARSKASGVASKVRSKGQEAAKSARSAYERNAGKRMANAINRDYARRQAFSKVKSGFNDVGSRASRAASEVKSRASSAASNAKRAYERNAGERMAKAINRAYERRIKKRR